MLNEQRKSALFIAFMRFCHRLPLPINHALGASLGFLFLLFPSRDRHVAWININIAFPHRTRWQNIQQLTQFFIELGKTVTELGIIWLTPQNKLFHYIKGVQGQSLMDQALATQKGVILLTPHCGTWELIGPYWSSKTPMTILYQPPEYAQIGDFIQQARERMGAILVPTDIRGVRALLTALKTNAIAGILPDQDPGKQGGVYAPFFGKPANTMTLAGKLAHKSHASVLLTVCERLSWGQGYVMHLVACPDEIHSADEHTAATAMNAGLEACIALAPAQYIWNYKRWRRQADDSNPYAH